MIGTTTAQYTSLDGITPGQGGFQILAILVAPLGNALVTMQRQFQQFIEFFVPLVQFLDRMVDIPVCFGYRGR